MDAEVSVQAQGQQHIHAWGHGRRRTCSIRRMLPHLADQFGDSIPVIFATSIVELLDIIRRFYRVGLELQKGNQ